jgi:hypothetical protein
MTGPNLQAPMLSIFSPSDNTISCIESCMPYINRWITQARATEVPPHLADSGKRDYTKKLGGGSVNDEDVNWTTFLV